MTALVFFLAVVWLVPVALVVTFVVERTGRWN